MNFEQKYEKTINLTASVQNKHSQLLITVENNIVVAQADKYSEVGQAIEDALRLAWIDKEIDVIKTWVVSEIFVVIEVKLKQP